ncbi:MAG: DUF4199 domain-containing protein [Bacteroidota bacterium]
MSLDDNREYIDEKSVPMWNTALTYGVVGGVLAVVFQYVSYSTMFASSSLGGALGSLLLNLLLYVGIIVFAIKKHRDQELGGYITMGRCLGVGILSVVVASLMVGIFDYVYIAFIDPEFPIRQAESMVWMYELTGLDEDTIEDTIEAMVEAARDVASNPNIVTSVLGKAFGGALLGLVLTAIIGAIMRKNPPEMA